MGAFDAQPGLFEEALAVLRTVVSDLEGLQARSVAALVYEPGDVLAWAEEAHGYCRGFLDKADLLGFEVRTIGEAEAALNTARRIARERPSPEAHRRANE